MGAKTAQPKSGKKHKRTKRKPDAPAQKRARTESQIGAVLLFFLGIAVMVLLSERVGFRTTAEETGHGRATIGSCEHKADGAHCRATLTSWTASAKPKAHHSPGETVTVMTNRSLTGEVEVAGRLAVGSRIAYNGTSRYTDFYTYERIVPRSDYVMPDWQRILYFVGFWVVWFPLMWWLLKLWFSFRTRNKPATPDPSSTG